VVAGTSKVCPQTLTRKQTEKKNKEIFIKTQNEELSNTSECTITSDSLFHVPFINEGLYI
jgi:type III secretory pathway component EscR